MHPSPLRTGRMEYPLSPGVSLMALPDITVTDCPRCQEMREITPQRRGRPRGFRVTIGKVVRVLPTLQSRLAVNR